MTTTTTTTRVTDYPVLCYWCDNDATGYADHVAFPDRAPSFVPVCESHAQALDNYVPVRPRRIGGGTFAFPTSGGLVYIEGSPITCGWSALCDHQAVYVRAHPILGAVPICERCREIMNNLESGAVSTGHAAVEAFGAAQVPGKLRPHVESLYASLDALRSNPGVTVLDLWEWAGSATWVLGYLLGAVEALSPDRPTGSSPSPTCRTTRPGG